MTQIRVPRPAGPAPRGPTSMSTRPGPIADAASEPVQPQPRIDLATGRVLPDLSEPVRRLPQPLIDLLTMRVLPDLPEPVRPLPQPRIDLLTMRVLPDLPEPVRPLPQPRIDLATGRVLPDLPEPVRPLPQPRIDFATGRVLPDLPEPVRPLPQPRIDFATGRVLPELPQPVSHAVQLRTAQGGAARLPASEVHATAAAGIRDGGEPLPHADRIQRAFGPDHDLSQVTAHVGGAATRAASQLGAAGYTVGDHVAFASAPDLHLAAHEAAHVVQQRRGVALSGGIGGPGDRYEQEADAVAGAVMAGRSAADLFGAPARSLVRPGVQLHPQIPAVAARFPGGDSAEREWERHERGEQLPELLTGDAQGALEARWLEVPDEPPAMRLWFERAIMTYGVFPFLDMVLALGVQLHRAGAQDTVAATKLRNAFRVANQLRAELQALISRYESTGKALMLELLDVTEEGAHRELQRYGFELAVAAPVPGQVIPVPGAGLPVGPGPASSTRPRTTATDRLALAATIRALKAKKRQVEARRAIVEQDGLLYGGGGEVGIVDPTVDAKYRRISAEYEAMWQAASIAHPILAGFKNGRDQDFERMACGPSGVVSKRSASVMPTRTSAAANSSGC